MARLLSVPRGGIVKVMMLATLIVSMVAVYPITPLYPQSGGNPILDDNSANTIYTMSALRYFFSVYSSDPVITSERIFWQLRSLDPGLTHLGWNTISPRLEDVTSPVELKHELVLFDTGGKSGTSTLAMRALAPDLRNTLGVVYSNGFFYIALAT